MLKQVKWSDVKRVWVWMFRKSFEIQLFWIQRGPKGKTSTKAQN